MTPQTLLIPDSAPFNEEQRAWLNGFLAGWVGLHDGQAGAAPVGATDGTGPTSPIVGGSCQDMEEEFPWHDPAIPLEERLALAEGRPAERRLMSAMAQLDCGSCGYDCKRYAEAIASGEERSLKLCSPGGKETAAKLKELVSLHRGNGPVTAARPPLAPSKDIAGSEWSRQNPFPATILRIRNLNGAGSAKQTSHVEIDLSKGDVNYQVGDALGVYPTNCPELVNELLKTLHSAGDESILLDGNPVSLRQALQDRLCLAEVTEELLELLQQRCSDHGESGRLQQLRANPEAIDGWDVLEVLRHFPSATISAKEVAGALSPLRPRLYSISSSLKAFPGQVHLTVGRVAWKLGQRTRKGVASTMFADRLQPGDPVRVFVHQSHGFSIPADGNSPLVMIGPGTGIAPFRAFLQERHAAGATGKNWLFFGDQRSETDFLYREELIAFQQSGLLTRLDAAFSRDQDNKIYVQHRMWEQGKSLWQWLDEGGHVYVCGDASRMAVDVDKTLREIISKFGGKSAEQADAFVADMLKSKRYCRDVY
jgi:sulfite reductase (NADPH) flavoprotein alpha-component